MKTQQTVQPDGKARTIIFRIVGTLIIAALGSCPLYLSITAWQQSTNLTTNLGFIITMVLIAATLMGLAVLFAVTGRLGRNRRTEYLARQRGYRRPPSDDNILDE